MAAEDVKKAADSLSCPICFQLFKNPKYLPCYHSYCEQCLENMVIKSEITCPECRQVVRVSNGVKELANNFLINRLVDELILKRKVDGEVKVTCEKCIKKDDPVVAFCPECTIFMCKVCKEQHLIDKSHHRHSDRIVSVTELRSIQVQVKTKLPKCGEGHDEKLKYFCETCDNLVCVYCTVTNHRDHKHDAVTKVAKKHQQELKKSTESLSEMIEHTVTVQNSVEAMREKIGEKGDQINKQIDEHYDSLVEELMMQKEDLKKQVHKVVSLKQEAVTAQLEEIGNVYKDLLKTNELKEVVINSSDHEILSTKKEVKHRMQQATSRYNKLSKKPVQSDSMEFLPSKIAFPQFGKMLVPDPIAIEVATLPSHAFVNQPIQVTIATKDHNGKRCLKGGSLISAVVENGKDAYDLEVTDNKNGSYSASFVSTKPAGKITLSVQLNGQTLVRHAYTALNKPSKIINNNGSMGEPWGIAFSKNGIWAVVDFGKHCVLMLNEQGKVTKTISKSTSTGENGHFKHPEGVAFDDKNNLYIADHGNHRVQKFSTDGKYLCQFGNEGSDKGQLKLPHGIAVHKDKLYVAEEQNKRVSVFCIDSQFSNLMGEGYLSIPYGVAVTTKDHLLVTDCGNKSVWQFSLDGKYIGKFGVNGSVESVFSWPCSITLDQKGFIIIGDSDKHCLFVFNEYGRYVYRFSSANCSIEYPAGVAVSPEGDIYISNRIKKEVQIFDIQSSSKAS